MTYLLDTDICIYWLNGRPQVKERVINLPQHQLALSVITQAELYYGAYNSGRPPENYQQVRQFLSQFHISPLNDNSTRQFGILKAQLRQSGQPIADFDLLIASIALVENCTLVTNNYRHYQRIPQLQLENWMSDS